MLSWLQRILGTGTAGDRGERLAAAWLRRERGFTIVARNWRSPRDRRDEIDLVARDGEVMVFVEVKTRGADALVPGYYAVDDRKKRVLRRAAQASRGPAREAADDSLRHCRGHAARAGRGGRTGNPALRKRGLVREAFPAVKFSARWRKLNRFFAHQKPRHFPCVAAVRI